MRGNQKSGNLKSRIFEKKNSSYNLIDVYDYLMVSYGYIPFKDFIKMDAHLVDELVLRINKRNEEQNKQMPKGRAGRRR